MTHLLLTGAGFSKNWGGLLASEVFNDLLSAGELDDPTRDMLYKFLRAGVASLVAHETIGLTLGIIGLVARFVLAIRP